jgi:large subunit ribosomal protein L28
MKRVAHEHRNVPPYPYGPNRWYKKSNLGLYGGLSIRSGFNVSDKTETKSRRRWRPNIVSKKLFSVSLGKLIKIKVATRVLRTIDKVGGLDAYLLGDKPARIKELGMFGWKLRWRIMQTERVKRRMRAQSRQLGLLDENNRPKASPRELIGMHGEIVSQQELDRQIAEFDAGLEEQGAEAMEQEDIASTPKQGTHEQVPAFMLEQATSEVPRRTV